MAVSKSLTFRLSFGNKVLLYLFSKSLSPSNVITIRLKIRSIDPTFAKLRTPEEVAALTRRRDVLTAALNVSLSTNKKLFFHRAYIGQPQIKNKKNK